MNALEPKLSKIEKISEQHCKKNSVGISEFLVNSIQ
jgi:hypothetical protein